MGNILSYLLQMILPALLGAVLWGLFRPWRLRRSAGKGQVPGPYREGALLLCFMFTVGLLALTLTPSGFLSALLSGELPELPEPFRGGLNLTPLKRSWELLLYYIRHDCWTAILVNYPGNVIMFLPIGLFSALLLDKPRWWKSLLISGGLSLFIEGFQLLVSRGTDVDDLILNLLGGLLGHWVFLLLRRMAPEIVKGCEKV